MPKDEFDQEDPFALVGMVLAGEQDAESFALMGRCFIEEFVRMGWDDTQILLLFQDPFYRGPHTVFQAKGAAFVHQLIAQVQREWNGDHCESFPPGGGRLGWGGGTTHGSGV